MENFCENKKYQLGDKFLLFGKEVEVCSTEELKDLGEDFTCEFCVFNGYSFGRFCNCVKEFGRTDDIYYKVL